MFKLGIIAAVFFTLYMVFWPYAWHQRITLILKTPDGELSGVGVTKVSWNNNFRILPDGADWGRSVSGEATILDLGNGRYIFALLKDMEWLALKSFEGRWNRLTPLSDRLSDIKSFNETKALNEKHYPLLVTFDDINDPASVKEVNPNDLAATFGEGYSLKSITLEITDEPVTEGEVEKVLGWMFDPKVMRNPGWKTIPVEARKLLRGYIMPFPKLGDTQ